MHSGHAAHWVCSEAPICFFNIPIHYGSPAVCFRNEAHSLAPRRLLLNRDGRIWIWRSEGETIFLWFVNAGGEDAIIKDIGDSTWASLALLRVPDQSASANTSNITNKTPFCVRIINIRAIYYFLCNILSGFWCRMPGLNHARRWVCVCYVASR